MAAPSKRRALLSIAVALAIALLAAATARADAGWYAYPLPTVGNGFALPLAAPTSLTCEAANRCLLLNEPSSGFAHGFFVFNGDKQPGQSGGGWRQYATVCGSAQSGQYGSVVWSGPTEFWTITAPSDPLYLAANVGLALCHFKDGQVVGSYSTMRSVTFEGLDPYRRMFAGACSSPSNCWFGGVAAARPDGSTPGTFHLHWDGSTLTKVYAPAMRAVSDIVHFDGKFYESVLAGPAPNAPADPALPDPPAYSPIQTFGDSAATAADFEPGDLTPAPVPGLPGDVTEVLALDAAAQPAGETLWAVGGGATSGPNRDEDLDFSLPGDDSPADRGPFAAYKRTSGGWTELPMPADYPDSLVNTRFVDVAAVPGTDKAFAAVRPDNQSTFSPQETRIATLDAGTGTVSIDTVAFLGSAEKVACVAADDCWAVTYEGYLLRFYDPAAQPVPADTDPAFTTTVTFRPNEVAEQAIGDAPPADDSLLFAPPPPTTDVIPNDGKVKRRKAAVQNIKSKVVGTTLVMKFRVIRPARVTVTAKRKGRVVATAKSGLLRRGRHSLKLKLSRDRWPTKLSMKVREPRR